MGNRAGYLCQAVTLLTEGADACITDAQCSAVYENPALLPEGSPPEWDRPFYNMAVGGQTNLEPDAVLIKLKSIERRMGRHKEAFWGPREIDIDIMVMDQRVVRSEQLSIPHEGLLKRAFFLLPLADVAPQWTYPLAGDHYGQTAQILAKQCDSSDMVRCANHPQELTDEHD